MIAIAKQNFKFITISIFYIFITYADQVQAGICNADVTKLCQNIKPGNRQIAKCLRENNDHVSSPCAELAMKIRKEKKILRQLCYKDVKATCSSVVPGQNRVYNCLSENSKMVSSACYSKLGEVMQLLSLK